VCERVGGPRVTTDSSFGCEKSNLRWSMVSNPKMPRTRSERESRHEKKRRGGHRRRGARMGERNLR
jgi:hypothetical protein